VPLYGEHVDEFSKPDVHENFDFGTQGHCSFEDEDQKLNQWLPEEDLPGFKDKVVTYWKEMKTLAIKLCGLFALALDL
jgi:isopenicillin N synthase-like dioxygenase